MTMELVLFDDEPKKKRKSTSSKKKGSPTVHRKPTATAKKTSTARNSTRTVPKTRAIARRPQTRKVRGQEVGDIMLGGKEPQMPKLKPVMLGEKANIKYGRKDVTIGGKSLTYPRKDVTIGGGNPLTYPRKDVTIGGGNPLTYTRKDIMLGGNAPKSGRLQPIMLGGKDTMMLGGKSVGSLGGTGGTVMLGGKAVGDLGKSYTTKLGGPGSYYLGGEQPLLLDEPDCPKAKYHKQVSHKAKAKRKALPQGQPQYEEEYLPEPYQQQEEYLPEPYQQQEAYLPEPEYEGQEEYLPEPEAEPEYEEQLPAPARRPQLPPKRVRQPVQIPPAEEYEEEQLPPSRQQEQLPPSRQQEQLPPSRQPQLPSGPTTKQLREQTRQMKIAQATELKKIEAQSRADARRMRQESNIRMRELREAQRPALEQAKAEKSKARKETIKALGEGISNRLEQRHQHKLEMANVQKAIETQKTWQKAIDYKSSEPERQQKLLEAQRISDEKAENRRRKQEQKEADKRRKQEQKEKDKMERANRKKVAKENRKARKSVGKTTASINGESIKVEVLPPGTKP